MRTRVMFPVIMAVGLVVLILASTSNAHAIGLLNIGHGCDGKAKCDTKAKPKCGAEPKAKCGAEPKCGAKAGHKLHLHRRSCDAKPKPKCGAEPKCGAKKKCGCSAA